MFRYVATRVALAIPVLIGASLISFLLIRLVPGDPALALLGTEADDASLATLRQAMALDQPIAVQFLTWISRVLMGDFGRSLQSGRQVLPMLMAAMGPTLILATTALVIAVAVGVPCGVFVASHRKSVRTGILTGLSLIGLSMPSFWLGLLLIMAFSIAVPLFPASGYAAPFASPFDHLSHLMLPALTLGIALAASTLRITRAAMLQALREPYMRTALAKGLSVRQAVWRHAFLNARATILVQMAVQAGKLLGGVVVIETVFSWPGLGKLVVDAVFARDYPVVQGAVLLAATVFVTINLLADIGHAMLDHRVRGQ